MDIWPFPVYLTDLSETVSSSQWILKCNGGARTVYMGGEEVNRRLWKGSKDVEGHYK